MATLGSADFKLVPKFSGLKEAVAKQLKEVEGSYQSSGESAGGGFGRGLLSSSASFGVFSALAGKALDTVTEHVGDAIARFDTLNNYPKVMQSLGYSADDADRSISTMSDRLSTLPTRLDDMASTVQGLSVITKDLDKATDAGLALNDMLLASGSSTQLTTAAMEQFRQMLSKGKPEMEDWKSLTSAMPGQLDQLAKSMLGPTANANDLYAALGGGKNKATISMDQLLDEIIRLDTEGGEGFASFREQAETAAGGIATSMSNTANAITKGLTGVLDTIGKDRIAGAFNGVKGAINDVFGTVNKVLEAAMPTISAIADNLGRLAPSALTAIVAFKGFSAVGGTMLDVGSKMTAILQGGASLAKMNEVLGTSFTPVTIALKVAAVAAGLLAVAYLDNKKRTEDLTKATDGLEKAVGSSTALDDYTSTIKRVGEGAEFSAKSVDELAESTSKHVETMERNNAKAEEQIAQLNTVQQVIGECVGQTDLSAEANGRLEWALSVLNDQMGLNITKNDVMNGQYVDADGNVKNLKQSVDELVESKKAEARAAALTDNLTEAYAVQADAADTLAQARKDYNDKVQWFVDNVPGITQADAEYRASLGETGKALESAKSQYDSAADAVSNLETELGMQAAATSESASALDRWAGSTSELFRSSLEANGTSISMLTEDLEALGVDTEALSSLTEEQLLSLADSYDGTAASAVQKLGEMGVAMENFNATPLVDKDGNVNVDTAVLMDAQGKLWTWNGSSLVDQYGNAAIEDQQVIDAQGHLWTWNGSNLQYKDNKGVVHDLMSDGIAKRDDWNRTGLNSYKAEGKINIFENITRTITSIFSSDHASGGIRLNAEGGYRMHAGGAIATRAVPLDIVGEDGAEAIVPLTNKRYSQPFVDLIAEGVTDRMVGTARASDDREIERLLRAILHAMPESMTPREFRRAVAACG